MSFWDSSAVVPLLVRETSSRNLLQLLRAEASLAVWWGTSVECASAISRREREDAMTAAEAGIAFERLRSLQQSWTEVSPSAKLREIAFRVLRVHPLRSSDSLQLAAAMIAAADEPETLRFVCLDDRLRLAAQREGFPVSP